MSELTADGPGDLLVCPTSHMDWDWHGTFPEYFEIGPIPGTDVAPGFGGAVQAILDGVCALLAGKPRFRYSMAEVAYLQAFLAARPDALGALLSAGPNRFELLGGGITSPDSLVCHGEVFIRNYLVGRPWLKSVGLQSHVFEAAWLPDDFGHDPQLPVVLAAMGLRFVGLSRVPGSPQPFPNTPLDSKLPSVAAQLNSDGLVFGWSARDGSRVLAHYMPSTYGAPWNGSAGATDLQTFAENHTTGWPSANVGRLLFAPAGGDFVFSQWAQGDWVSVVDAYNEIKKATDPTAKIGTFRQFMNQATGHAGKARNPLLAQNYWTGIFASRPRLKTLHYQAAQLAMGAETAAALLRLASTYSPTALDDLDAAIDQAWQALVPSSHHDYITGTSPDRVYWSEQLPLLQQAVRLANQCLNRAVRLIARAVDSGGTAGQGTPVVVFNPLGFARSGGVASLPAQAVPGSFAGASTGSATGPVQRAADGGLLFQVPGEVGSFGYTTVTLQPGDPEFVPPPAPSDTVTLDNNLVKVTLDRTKAWAITSFVVGGKQLLPMSTSPPGLGNSIRLYHDEGNLYQFGNETLQQNQPSPAENFCDTGTSLAAGTGEWIEAGPVRWHFRATVTGTYGTPPATEPVSYTLDYLLYAGETVLRMRLTGAAPTKTSVLTAFDLYPPSGPAGYGLTYGTAHHWDDHQPTPYWDGPTFRATHDFLQTTGATGPQLAIYHQGVPAWSTVWYSTDINGQLLGALLRNTPGTDRGAAGTDPGVHTLEYALGPAETSPVATGEALRTALAVTNPLVAAVARINQPVADVSLPAQASLAKVTQPPTGILRVARTQPGSSAVVIPGSYGNYGAYGNYYAERVSYTLRVYLPAPSPSGVTITLPSLPNPGIAGYDPDLTAVAVSALEEPLADPLPVTVNPDKISVSFTSDRALTTVRLTATRCPTRPDTGKKSPPQT